MAYEEIHWRCDGHDISIGIDRTGEGRSLLLLPALSSISTRREMQPLQERLARGFATISIDWPGFGELPKPRIDWRPAIYEQFLDDLLTHIEPDTYGIIAAGHAGGYALKYLARHQHLATRLVLLSPTWRGPLPTMMGGDRAFFRKIARAFDPPVLGSFLYSLNVNRFVVGMMARGHVYSDPAWITADRMEEKLVITRAPGARHASARFVTGRLDPFGSRDEQNKAAQEIDIPTLIMFSESAPEKSRLEMESLTALHNMRTIRMPRGKLSFYEEFPDETTAAIHAFMADVPA